MTDLVGKKKLIINKDAWGAPERSGSVPLAASPEQLVSPSGNPGSTKGMFFLKYNSGGTAKGFVDQDNLRIALGHSWNEAPSDSFDPDSPVTVGNNWGPLNVFFGKPLELSYCNFTPDSPGFLDFDAADFNEAELTQAALYAGVPDPFFLGACWTEKVTVKVSGLTAKDAPLDDKSAKNPELALSERPNFNMWSGFIKCGITSNGNSYAPLIRNEGTGPGHFVSSWGHSYRDHYHTSVSPFTPKELLIKQPFGKSATADVSTYYNSRINSKPYEEELASTLDLIMPTSRDTFIPSPYGFLRILLNKFELEDLYDLDSAGEFYNAAGEYTGPTGSVFPHNFGGPDNWAPNFGLEILTTNFGRVPPSVISKFMKMKSKNLDISAFYEDFFNVWSASIRTLVPLIPEKLTVQQAQGYLAAVLFVNQRLSNLAFSPDILKNLEKIHQIKKYFPFYSEIEFQTKIITELGDLIKKLLFTKFFVNKVAEYNTLNMISDEHTFKGQKIDEASSYVTVPYFDYYSEHHYDNIKDANLIYKTGNDLGQTVVSSPKKTHDLIHDLNLYMSDPDYYKAPVDGHTSDIQDYISYIRHDMKEPINMSEFNQIWKIVLGGVLKSKLLKIYKNKHRSFKDLLEGKPAYHEVVAYKIEKMQKNPDQADDEFVLVQNIIIPNTSELDLFKYVDSQLLYGTDKVYRYNVYEIKIVFGCQYRYAWNSAPSAFTPVDMSNPDGVYDAVNWEDLERDPKPDSGMTAQPWGGHPGQQYSATFNVSIIPDIVLMEDLYFQTPDVIISDNPPVPPDVNIVPYRAINNKILILLDGLTDTYRAKPVIMLPSDEAEYDFIKKAQISPDDKVLFSSDDPVREFQIFRTDKKPFSYKDFELYATISDTHYDEKISPNKKYYYTFRAIDGHGHISNPTEVYEVELIDDHGAVKPMIRIFNFEEPKYSSSIKECQKYLMIRPSLEQAYYDGKSELDHMFNSPDDAKKRKFKVRVTSKATGKKFDINLAFNKKQVTEE